MVCLRWFQYQPMDLRDSPVPNHRRGSWSLYLSDAIRPPAPTRHRHAAGSSALRRSGLRLGGRASSVDMELIPFRVLLPFSYTRGCAQDELRSHYESRVCMYSRPGGTGCTIAETRRG